MLPKEHGAYGQLLFPMVTALAVGRPGRVALLLTAAAVCAFLAHEPLLVLIGQRGVRAAREQRGRAAIWFGAFAAAAALCGIAALVLASGAVRIALVVPAGLATVLVVLIVSRHERTIVGEILTAVALASLARPVALASDASPIAAMTAAAVFVGVFASGTVGVRAVIACTRRPPARVMRASATMVAVASVVLLWWIAPSGIGASAAPWAALPGCALAVVLAAVPPSASRLRVVGWSLVIATTVTAGMLVATLR